jgi:hypothetical protein
VQAVAVQVLRSPTVSRAMKLALGGTVDRKAFCLIMAER